MAPQFITALQSQAGKIRLETSLSLQSTQSS